MTNEQVYACECVGLEMGAKGALCNRENVRMILESDVDALMDVWFDEASKTYRDGSVTEGVSTTLSEIADLFRDYVASKYGMRMGQWTDKFVRPEIASHLRDNARDGLKEAIEDFWDFQASQGQWDGEERIRDFFKDLILKREDLSVFVDWYISAFKRLINPGMRSQGVLVIKTDDKAFVETFMMWLFSIHPHLLRMWNRTPLAPSSVDFNRIVTSSAVVQLEGVKPTDGNMWKLGVQALTVKDSIRLPYERKTRQYPRRCSMLIVTEDDFDVSEHSAAWCAKVIEWPVGYSNKKEIMRELMETRHLLACEALAKVMPS